MAEATLRFYADGWHLARRTGLVLRWRGWVVFFCARPMKKFWLFLVVAVAQFALGGTLAAATVTLNAPPAVTWRTDLVEISADLTLTNADGIPCAVMVYFFDNGYVAGQEGSPYRDQQGHLFIGGGAKPVGSPARFPAIKLSIPRNQFPDPADPFAYFRIRVVAGRDVVFESSRYNPDGSVYTGPAGNDSARGNAGGTAPAAAPKAAAPAANGLTATIDRVTVAHGQALRDGTLGMIVTASVTVKKGEGSQCALQMRLFTPDGTPVKLVKPVSATIKPQLDEDTIEAKLVVPYNWTDPQFQTAAQAHTGGFKFYLVVTGDNAKPNPREISAKTKWTLFKTFVEQRPGVYGLVNQIVNGAASQ